MIAGVVPSRYVWLSCSVLLCVASVYGAKVFVAADYFTESGEYYLWSPPAGYSGNQFLGLCLTVVTSPLAALTAFLYLRTLDLTSLDGGVGGGAGAANALLPGWLRDALSDHPSHAWKLGELAVILCGLLTGAVLSGRDWAWQVLRCGVLCYGSYEDDDAENVTNAFKVTWGLTYFFSCLIMATLVTVMIYKSAVALSRHPEAASGAGTNRGEEVQLLTTTSTTAATAASGSGSNIGSKTTTNNNTNNSSSNSGTGRPPLPPSVLGGPPMDGAANGAVTTASERYVLDREQERMQRVFWGLIAFLVFYPFVVLLCMSLPDWWAYFSRSDIATYESEKVTDGDEKTGSVWNIVINSNLSLKLYGDILMYYVFIYCIALIGVASLVWKDLRRALSVRLFSEYGVRLTLGEIGAILAFSLLLMGELVYWYTEHGWMEESRSSFTKAERMARTFGQLANVTMGLLVLPVSRNSVWISVIGISWEAALRFHTWMGYLFLAIVFIHMCLWWKVFDQNGYFPHDILAVPTKFHNDNFTIPLAAISAWFMWIFMGVFSYETVRRKFFEVFYYAHHFFVVLFLVVLLHATMSWYYVLAGIVLWVVDRAMRFCKGCAGVQLVALEPQAADVTKISYVIQSGGSGPWGAGYSAMRHAMGQYAFLCVPTISGLQWHPFTLSSAPQDNVSTHYIKSMGDDTWTGRLHELARTVSDSSRHVSVPIGVDGPYGVPFDPRGHTHVLFIAGGIGVTPMISCLRCLHALAMEQQQTRHRQDLGQDPATDDKLAAQNGGGASQGAVRAWLPQRVRLLWVARDPAIFDVFHETLQRVHDESDMGRFSVQLFCTGSTAGERGGGMSSVTRSGFVFEAGRPRLAEEIEPLNTFGQDGAVFVCGPNAMRDEVVSLASTKDLKIKVETFEV